MSSTPGYRCTTYGGKTSPSGTIFFVSSFKTKAWFYKLALNQLVAKGYRVLAYDYESRPLLGVYPEDWPRFSKKIVDDISQRVSGEIKENPASRFAIIGVSVGAAVALHAAKEVESLEKVVLVTTYGSMVRHLWEHPALNAMRAQCVAQGLDSQSVRDSFGLFEPSYGLEALGQRPILLFVNQDDQVIPFDNTKIFIDAARATGIDLEVRQIEALRHSTTIIRAFIRLGSWVDFLDVTEPAVSEHEGGLVHA